MADWNLEYARSQIKSNKENMLGLLFASDIIIDEEAFKAAVTDLDELIEKIERLKGKVNEMMSELERGLDTNAGRKFISACDNCLIDPIDKQQIVIEHIAQALDIGINKYRSIFDSYSQLQTALNNIDPV